MHSTHFLTHCVHLLLAVCAASPVTSDGDCPYSHQKDDHHVVVQHRLIGCIHGDESSFPKGLQESETALKQLKAKAVPHPGYCSSTVCREIYKHLLSDYRCFRVHLFC